MWIRHKILSGKYIIFICFLLNIYILKYFSFFVSFVLQELNGRQNSLIIAGECLCSLQWFQSSCTSSVLLWFFGCRIFGSCCTPLANPIHSSLSFTHCHWRIDFSLLYSNLSQFILDCSMWNILISYHTAIQLTIPFLTCHQGNSVACFLLAIKFLFHMLNVALNVLHFV